MSNYDPKAKRPRDLVCAGCGKGNRDQKLVQFSDGNVKCWSCGHLEVKAENRVDIKTAKEFKFTPEIWKAIPNSVIQPYLYNQNMLGNFLRQKFGYKANATLQRYFCGTDKTSNRTAFIFKDIHQNYRSIKSVQYLPNGKRDKTKFPYVPYRKADGFSQCLFGEHLLKDYTGIVNLVESEKTAIIAAIKFPDHLWLATGGSNGLSYDKAQHLRGRIVYKYVDCDKAGRSVDRDTKVLAYFNASLQVKDLAPEREDGTDIADLILEKL
jgi:hypothetical protein